MEETGQDGGTEAYGKYVDAEDVLGERPNGDGESEDESGDEDESGESETEDSESESGSESESESEFMSETETESETGTEAETSEAERSTAAGDGMTPRAQHPQPADDDARSRTPPAAGDNVESLVLTPPDEDAQTSDAQPAPPEEAPAPPPEEASAPPPEEASAPPPEEAPAPRLEEAPAPPLEEVPAPLPEKAPAPPVSSWYLPPAPSRGASREGNGSSQQHACPAEDARTSGTEPGKQGQGEPVPFSLPPAVSRSGSRECSRKSSHHEASTSGSGLAQAPSSLPPINKQRSGSQPSRSQPSRKGSTTSSQAAAEARRSRAPSPNQGSPTRNPIAAPRYYKPPPPPPPPPKPKPRERHDVSAVDPVFLQTAVYRTVPNVGRVYDWQLQHEVNAALSKQRKQQAQMEKVLKAARVQLQVREANERAFQQWVASKEQEKQQQHQQNRRIAYVTSVYHNLVKEDPVERRVRESLWVSNFAYPSSGGDPPRIQPRERVSESSERFRL